MFYRYQLFLFFYIVSPMDYIYNPLSSLLRIDACQKKRCITIFIVDDVNADDKKETFNVTVDRSENVPPEITIDPAEAVVEISEKSKYLY